MELFEVVYYSIEEGYMCPETSWIVEAKDVEEVFARCEELTKKFGGGVFAPRAVSYMKLNELTDEKILEELELL